MEEIKLDLKDRKLLYELDVNARQTMTRLGKKLRMSKQLVKFRIQRLEKQGIIKGYYTIIDFTRLGYLSFRVYLKLKGIKPQIKNEMTEYIKKRKAIFAVARLSGKWDIAYLLNVKNPFSFYEYWDAFLENYLEHIDNYNISLYSPIYHYSKSYIIDKKDRSPVRILGGQEKENTDKLDIDILHHIAENARLPLVKISNNLKRTPETINYRLKNLEKKGIIQGYRAMIDIGALGYEFYKVDFRLRSFKEFKKLLAFTHKEPNIYQLNRTIGGENLEIEFQVRNLRELLNMIEKIEKEFPETFDSYDYYPILEELKIVYMPEI